MPSNRVWIKVRLGVSPKRVYPTPAPPRATSTSSATTASTLATVAPLLIILLVVGFMVLLLTKMSSGSSDDDVIDSALSSGTQLSIPTTTPVPQPTQTTTPVISPLIPISVGQTRVDSLNGVGDQNRYVYTARQGETLEVKVTPKTVGSIDVILTREDGDQRSDFGLQCYDRKEPFFMDFGGPNTGGNGQYVITILSGCPDNKAIGTYEIYLYVWGHP